MPDKRQHRGPNPRDQQFFPAENLLQLRSTVADLSPLLSLGYPEKASLKLDGDHCQSRIKLAAEIIRDRIPGADVCALSSQGSTQRP